MIIFALIPGFFQSNHPILMVLLHSPRSFEIKDNSLIIKKYFTTHVYYKKKIRCEYNEQLFLLTVINGKKKYYQHVEERILPFLNKNGVNIKVNNDIIFGVFGRRHKKR